MASRAGSNDSSLAAAGGIAATAASTAGDSRYFVRCAPWPESCLRSSRDRMIGAHDAETRALARERGLCDGFDSLGDAELLALLLGTGCKGRRAGHVAADLLEHAGGLSGLVHCGAHVLAERPGVGLAKAARIAAGLELGRRAMVRASAARRLNLASSSDVAAWARPRLSALDHEQMWVLALDCRNGLRAARRVAEGGLHGCSIDTRDVLRAAVREAASAFVLVHNHPSGDPTPSAEDVDLTHMIARAATAVGTPLVDHVIVGGQNHVSLFDVGIVSRRTR
jgi:DNA repair protein RadC